MILPLVITYKCNIGPILAVFLFSLSVSLSAPVCWGAHGKYAQKLLNDLFTNYTSALRPVENTNDILNVTLQITLSQIIDMVMLLHIRSLSYPDLVTFKKKNK